MKTTQKNLKKFNNTAACIVAASVSPFALCGLSSMFSSHKSCTAIFFYWLVTIAGLLAARQIKELGRRYSLTISKDFIIYKEPFASKLVKFADVLSIHAAPDNHLVFTTLSTRLVVPRSVFTCYDELAQATALLKRFAPSSCRIDLHGIALQAH